MWNWNRVESQIEDEVVPEAHDRLLNFEDFVKIMHDKMMDEQKKMEGIDIVFESQSSNVSWLFWPY